MTFPIVFFNGLHCIWGPGINCLAPSSTSFLMLIHLIEQFKGLEWKSATV